MKSERVNSCGNSQ